MPSSKLRLMGNPLLCIQVALFKVYFNCLKKLQFRDSISSVALNALDICPRPHVCFLSDHCTLCLWFCFIPRLFISFQCQCQQLEDF